jgi:hypothetical protein
LRVLPFAIVEQHVAAEMRVAAEDLVRAFAGQHHLVAGIAHRPAQQIFGDAMGVEAHRLALGDGIGEMVRQILLPDRDRIECGAGLLGHLLRDRALVIVAAVKGQGEGTDRLAMVPCRKAEHRAGIETAAQIAADRNIGPEAQADRLLERVPELGRVIGVGALRPRRIGLGIVEIPIAHHLDVPIAGDEVMARRHLEHAVIKGAHRMPARLEMVVERLGIPARRHTGGEERLHLGGEIERATVPGIEQRLDAEPVARSEEQTVALVEQDKGEFAAQTVQALRTEIFVEMKRNLAVGAGPQAVTGSLKRPLDRLIAVELAIDDDPCPFVLAGDRLVSRRKIDDAEPRMAEADTAVRRDPIAPPIRATMMKAAGGPLERAVRYRLAAGENCNESAHIPCPIDASFGRGTLGFDSITGDERWCGR